MALYLEYCTQALLSMKKLVKYEIKQKRNLYQSQEKALNLQLLIQNIVVDVDHLYDKRV